MGILCRARRQSKGGWWVEARRMSLWTFFYIMYFVDLERSNAFVMLYRIRERPANQATFYGRKVLCAVDIRIRC